MTNEGVQSVLDAAEIIGDNVYKFYPKFAEYEKIFETESGTLTRDEVKALYPNNPNKMKKTLAAYDEINFLKNNKDIVCLLTSAQAIFDGTKYDFINAKVVSDNIILVDRESGDTHCIATDQVNDIVRFNKNAKASVYDKETGEYFAEKEINKERYREPLFYQF